MVDPEVEVRVTIRLAVSSSASDQGMTRQQVEWAINEMLSELERTRHINFVSWSFEP